MCNLAFLILLILIPLGFSVIFRTNNALVPYYFMGLCGIPVSALLLFLLSAVLTAALLIVVWLRSRMKEELFLLLFTGCSYCLGILIYFVWSSDLFHLCSCLVVMSVFGLLLLYSLQKEIPESFSPCAGKFLRILYWLTAFAVIISILLQLGSYWNFSSCLRNNVIYEWKNPFIEIRSTAEEKLIQKSVDLIKKYTPENQKGIAVFSKYDNILPFAAGKYSDLPYPDLQWFLVSPKEEAEIIRYFEQQKPEYIFVDTDVERNFEYDRPPLLSSKVLLSEYVYRVERLNLLKNLWHKLKINYELKEKTPLLSVWKRKEK